jgi:hypothetical protein
VDLPRQQLLAGAGLATDQHRQRLRRQALEAWRSACSAGRRTPAPWRGCSAGSCPVQGRSAAAGRKGLKGHGKLPPGRAGRGSGIRGTAGGSGAAQARWSTGPAGDTGRRSPVPSARGRT